MVTLKSDANKVPPSAEAMFASQTCVRDEQVFVPHTCSSLSSIRRACSKLSSSVNTGSLRSPFGGAALHSLHSLRSLGLFFCVNIPSEWARRSLAAQHPHSSDVARGFVNTAPSELGSSSRNS